MLKTEDYKRELISILFAQKHLIFWTAFAIFAGAVWIAFSWPATYAAKGSVLVTGKQLMEKGPEALQKGETRLYETKKEDLASEVQILTSPEVVGSALRKVGAKHPQLAAAGAGADADPVYRVLRNLKTTIVPASNVIDVQLLNGQPLVAVDLLGAIMDEYLAYRQQFYRVKRPSAEFFAQQAQRFNDGIRQKEDEQIGLVSETGVSDPRTEIAANIHLKKNLEESLNGLRSQRIDTSLTLQHIEKALGAEEIQYFSYINNPLISEISLRVAALQTERGTLLRIYQPGSEKVAAVDEQLRETWHSLRGEVAAFKEDVRRRLAVLDQQIRQLELDIAGYDRRNVALNAQLVESERLAREAGVLKTSFEQYSARRDEVEINAQLGEGEPLVYASIMNRAFPSDGPVFPQRNVVIPFGLLVGLLVGCSLGFVREYFDHTFKKPSDVAAYTGLPVLFSIGRPQRQSAALLAALLPIAALALLAAYVLAKVRAGG
jgi:uncharacterized protein involved in exopolysaccharide biosynthesis